MAKSQGSYCLLTGNDKVYLKYSNGYAISVLKYGDNRTHKFDLITNNEKLLIVSN